MVILVAVINVAIYYPLLEQRYGLSTAERSADDLLPSAELCELRSFAVIIIRMFVRLFRTYRGGVIIDALEILRQPILHFGQALINYAVYMQDVDGTPSQLTPEYVRREVSLCLNSFWVQQGHAFVIPDGADAEMDNRILYVDDYHAVRYESGTMGPDIPLAEFNIS